jgi:hypothetical protein
VQGKRSRIGRWEECGKLSCRNAEIEIPIEHPNKDNQ